MNKVSIHTDTVSRPIPGSRNNGHQKSCSGGHLTPGMLPWRHGHMNPLNKLPSLGMRPRHKDLGGVQQGGGLQEKQQSMSNEFHQHSSICSVRWTNFNKFTSKFTPLNNGLPNLSGAWHFERGYTKQQKTYNSYTYT